MHTPTTPSTESDPSYSPDVTLLMEMLRYKRPKGSITEHDFILKYLAPLGVYVDKSGNVMKRVGKDPRVLWSSHTDTVHRTDGFQRIVYDKGIIRLHKKASSSCLGADCTAGVWMMMEMVKARVPGLYVWHYGEENGCIGSRAIAEKWPALLEGIDIAVAFDRRGKTSVITHMGNERTCSEAFATSLMAQLPTGFKADDTGRSTDTKQYIKLVSECTNISVGFDAEHTSRESLDVDHLLTLRDAMVKIQVADLVVVRDKTKTEYKKYEPVGYGGGYAGWKAGAARQAAGAYEDYVERAYGDDDSKLPTNPRACISMFQLLFTFPETAARVLINSLGVSLEEMKTMVAKEMGYAPRSGLEGVKKPSVGPAGTKPVAPTTPVTQPASVTAVRTGGATASTNVTGLNPKPAGTPPAGATAVGKPVHPTLPRAEATRALVTGKPPAVPAAGFRSPGSGKDLAPRHIPSVQAPNPGQGSNVIPLLAPGSQAGKAPAALKAPLEPITPALSSLVEGIRAAEKEAEDAALADLAEDLIKARQA